MNKRRWYGRYGIVMGFILILGMVLGACQPEDEKPLPTLANPTELAATAGIIPPEAINATLTARVPTDTPTDTITPTDTVTDTPTDTPTDTITPSPTATERPFADNPEPNVLLMSANMAGTNDIWVMNFDGSNLRPVHFDFISDDLHPACEPQGSRLMFEGNTAGDREIYLIEYPNLVPRPLTDTPGENFHPVWSPDANRVAFVSTRNGNADIWVMDAGGGNLEQITTNSGNEMYPSWSPDATQLWYSSNRDGNFDIYFYDFTTGEETPFAITPNQNETQPVLSPNGQTVAFVDETTPLVVATGAIFVANIQTGERDVKVAGEGRVEMPVWIDAETLVVSADSLTDGVALLKVNLTTNELVQLTQKGFNYRWARVCYLPEETVANFPQLPSPTPNAQMGTAIVEETQFAMTQTAVVQVTASPEINPTLLTPTPLAPEQGFIPVEEPEEDWLISSETWIGDEFKYVAPTRLQSDSLAVFLVDNLVNYTWQDDDGKHVLSMALEAYRGALEATVIGYTVNDFPGDYSTIEGIEIEVRDQILLNSVRHGAYHLAELQVSNVNVTFVFRVPLLAVNGAASVYTPVADDPANNWLISTERWTPQELAMVLTTSLGVPVGLDFVEEQYLRYSWIDSEGARVLIIEPTASAGDLVFVPISYTVEGDAQDPAAITAVVREGILFHSLPPGEFQLARITMSRENMEMIFVIPPKFED